jgi:23S rRNA (cytidine1920-2'-O)/16S rRNA (cytidine1409-2'-O)-methyltransferase
VPPAGASRLDAELVRRGLARSRARARELIAAGHVLVDGTTARKPAMPVTGDADVVLAVEPDPWVSRAAYKLLEALETFGPRGLRVTGKRCIDVGASTGGFTQVLLAHGASHVDAIDVGHGQLAPQVSGDPRVTERSGVNVRDVDPREVGGPAELVVADLSFISLQTVMPALRGLTAPDGDLVLLVKPQFEVGRERLGKGGLVRRAEDRARAVADAAACASAAGLQTLAMHRSPIRGTSGNWEYLLWCSPRPAEAMSPFEVAEAAHRLSQEGPL